MRSGATSLLDLDLDIGKKFFDQDPELDDHWVYKPPSVENTIDFLIQQGASIHRWKSLTVRARIPQVLYKVLEYIRPESATSLRFLSLEWKTRLANSQIGLERETVDYLSDYEQPCYKFGDQLARLRTAHLNALPADFLLGRPLPILTGLVHLKLTPAFSLCSHIGLGMVLLANPLLESLDINSGFAFGHFESTDLRVALPNLSSLTLNITVKEGSLSWILGIMNMVDGPGVEHLAISGTGLAAEAISKLATQIANCRPKDEAEAEDEDEDEDEDAPTQSLYPALQSLDISGIRTPDCAEAFQELFAALPTVTFLTASRSALEKLDVPPWVLPCLERIRVSGEVPPEIDLTLREREMCGFPVKTLEARKGSLEPVMGFWPKSLTVVELPIRCISFLASHESDSDDDSEDTYDPEGDSDDSGVYPGEDEDEGNDGFSDDE